MNHAAFIRATTCAAGGGLPLADAPLIAQLDVDMVPTREFLIRLVEAVLPDDRIAFAYCPQTFYNWGPMDVLDDHQARRSVQPLRAGS